MLQIKLFGSGQATYFGRPLMNFPSQQPHHLLCYILLHSRYPVLRDQLASTFWADNANSVSRKYLRNALWKLRQVFDGVEADLDAYMLVSDDSVAIRRASPYWLDVDVFETAVDSCQGLAGAGLNPAQAALLADAVELYSGDLLEGVYCDWCLYERERLSLLHLAALGKLMAFHEASANWERGLAYGERILARDNTRERVHLQMMRLYWLAGDRDAALAQYKRCIQVLGDELGVAPMRETTQVFQQMAHNQYNPLPALAASRPFSLPAAAPRRSAEQNESLLVLAEKTLQRVQALQTMLEETRAELGHIEALIHRELLKNDPAV